MSSSFFRLMASYSFLNLSILISIVGPETGTDRAAPNTIQQDIHSDGYSASREFASPIFDWNVLLLIRIKIPNYDQNDSYSTQWHTKAFQSVKLVSLYSNSVSRKNSKCLDFVLVQVTGIVQKDTISLSCHTKSKNDSYSTQ